MKKISVVIPVYNGQDLLEKTLDSVFAQAYDALEVLVVDDGSSDRTPEVLAEYAKKEPRLSFFRVPNGGPSRARNEGIRRAAGEYLYLCDADDWLAPGMLGKLAGLLDEGADLAACGYWQDTEAAGKVVSTQTFSVEKAIFCASAEEFRAALPDLLEKRLMYVSWNKLYRMELVRTHSVAFPDFASCEDRLFNVAYDAHVERFSMLAEPLFHYMVRGNGNLASRFLPNKFTSLETFDRELRALYADAKLLNDRTRQSCARIFLKGAVACLISLYHASCPLKAAEKRAFADAMLESETMHRALAEVPGGGSFGLIKVLLRRKNPRLALLLGWGAAMAGTKLPGLMNRLNYRK